MDINKILLQDVNTLASDNLESIDRVTPSYFYYRIKKWKRIFMLGFYKWKWNNLRWWLWEKQGKVTVIEEDAFMLEEEPKLKKAPRRKKKNNRITKT